jgi:hypothetical protein
MFRTEAVQVFPDLRARLGYPASSHDCRRGRALKRFTRSEEDDLTVSSSAAVTATTTEATTTAATEAAATTTAATEATAAATNTTVSTSAPAAATDISAAASAMAATATSAVSASWAVTSATRATVAASAGWKTSGNSPDAKKEDWWREHGAAQSIQRRDFLFLGFGGVFSRVTLLARHHQIAVVLGLMAFINA